MLLSVKTAFDTGLFADLMKTICSTSSNLVDWELSRWRGRANLGGEHILTFTTSLKLDVWVADDHVTHQERSSCEFHTTVTAATSATLPRRHGPVLAKRTSSRQADEIQRAKAQRLAPMRINWYKTSLLWEKVNIMRANACSLPAVGYADRDSVV